MRKIFSALKNMIINISKKISNIIKSVSLFLWNYFFMFIYVIFKVVILKTYLYVFKIPLFFIYKKILKPVGIKANKYLIKPAYLLVKKVYYFLKRIILFLYLIFKVIIINTYFYVFKIPLVFIYKKLLKPVGIKTNKYLIKPFGKLIKSFYYLVRRVSLFVYKNFFYQIFIFFKKILLSIYQFLKVLNNFVIKFYKWLFRSIIKFFKNFILFFKYLYLNIPNFIYRSIFYLFLYLYLILNFIFYQLLYLSIKYLFKIIKVLFENILKVLNLINNFIFKLFRKIFKIFSLLTKKIYFFFRDYSEYLLMIILAPLILASLLISILLISVIELFSYFKIFILSLLKKSIKSDYELFEISNYLKRSKLLIHNYNLYYANLLVLNKKTNKFNSYLYFNKLIVSRSIFILVIILFYVLLLPFTLIDVLRKNEPFKLKPNKNSINGIIYFKEFKYLNKKYNIIKDDFTLIGSNLYIIKEEISNISIKLLEDNTLKDEFNLEVELLDFVSAKIILDKIKENLTKQTRYKLRLEEYNDLKYQVRYKNVFARDLIKDNTLTLRTNAHKTIVECMVFNNENLILSEQVNIYNLTNIKDLEKVLKRKYDVTNGFDLKKILPKHLNVSFIENNFVSKEGIVKTNDNVAIYQEFKILGFDDVYLLNLEVIVSDNKLLEYTNFIEANFLDHEKRQVNLNQLEFNGITKEVTYYLDYLEITNESDLEFIYERLVNNKSRKVTYALFFNSKLINKKINFNLGVSNSNAIIDELSKKYKISNENIYLSSSNVSKIFNKYYIKFPKISFNHGVIFYFESSDKTILKDNGLLNHINFEEVNIKVIAYYSLFKKEVLNLKLINKIKEEN